MQHSGSTKTAGSFYSGTTAPTNSNRTNYDGYLYATRFYGHGGYLTSLDASNLTSGTVPIARIPTGTTSTTVSLGNHTHTNMVTGTGTTSYVTRWTGASAIGIGVLYDNGTNVGISTTSPSEKLDVAGKIKAQGVIVKQATDASDLLFAVRNSQGHIVFAVYEKGVRIFIDGDPTIDTKGNKGGFAIGGLTGFKDTGEDYFRVSRGYTHVLFDTDLPGKGNKSGFAIGGLTGFKEQGDRSQIPSLDSDFGGTENFGNKSNLAGYMSITPDNYLIGQDAGKSLTTGLYNTFMGYQAGQATTRAFRNVFIGYQAGFSNIGHASLTRGSYNVFLGNQSGYSNTTGMYNVFLGHESGYSSSTAYSNVFLGYQSGRGNTTGQYNAFVGYRSGYSNATGHYNVFLGYEAGYNNAGTAEVDQGCYNVFLGYQAGRANTTGYANTFVGRHAGLANTTANGNAYFGQYAGRTITTGYANTIMGTNAGHAASTTSSQNTFLGAWAGQSTSGNQNTYVGHDAGAGTGNNNTAIGYAAGYQNSGSGNVFIGYYAGYNIGAINDRLYINNASSASPLIYGSFVSAKMVVIAGNHNDNSSYRLFFVNGTAGGKFPWYNDSDERLKKNIQTIESPLEKVTRLRGVTYEWIDKDSYEKGRKMGFIAQEAIGVIPEVVDYNEENDSYAMQYSSVNALLVEAIKEQQNEIEKLQNENTDLKARLERLEQMMSEK